MARTFLRNLMIAAALGGSAFGQLWRGQTGNIDELERKARQGDAEAMAEFAWHLLEGQGGRRFVPAEIRDWFEKAAEKGDALGKVGLSRCLVDGIGGPSDFRKARQWAESAADVEHPEGWKQLAHLLDKGKGVAMDKERAMELTIKARDAGSVAAACNLRVYRGGPDYMGHAELAIKTGHLQSARNALYGYYWMRDDLASAKRVDEVIDLVEERAKLDHPLALLALGFVRSCQGDDDAEAALKTRALMTGTAQGYNQLLGELSRAGPHSSKNDEVTHYLRRLDHRRLEWWAYQHGIREPWNVTRVTSSLLEPLDDRKPDPKLAISILREAYPDKDKVIDFSFAWQFMQQMSLFKRSEISADLALAHAIHACDKNPQAIGAVAYFLSGRQQGMKVDLPRAYAAVRHPEGRNGWNEAQIETLKGMLDEGQLKQADILFDEQFPKAAKFIEEAGKIIEEARAPDQD